MRPRARAWVGGRCAHARAAARMATHRATRLAMRESARVSAGFGTRFGVRTVARDGASTFLCAAGVHKVQCRLGKPLLKSGPI
eukprot:6210260-Pleurochrysis_carterae.AAC.2